MEFDVITELRKSYNGDTWHGSNLLQILNAVNPEKAFGHHIPNAHSIAEVVLHLTGWTKEVTSRLLGNEAKEPEGGDWPLPNEMSLKSWDQIVFDCKVSNEELVRICGTQPDKAWKENTVDKREAQLGVGVTKIELVNGLIQHHAYHAGQIALLQKF